MRTSKEYLMQHEKCYTLNVPPFFCILDNWISLFPSLKVDLRNVESKLWHMETDG